MTFDQKQQQLDQIYEIYASFTNSLDLACRKYCCRCCTRNVTLTSLEAAYILERLDPIDSERLVQQIRSAAAFARFQPRITTNELAERCMRGEPLPEEACDPHWGACPLLEEQSCPLYAHRPFACRCLISQRVCEKNGHADIDEFALTVNSVFLQVIEHLDRGGCTGNFTDVILYLSEPENMRAYRQGRLECTAGGLIGNRPLNVLMIPPHHRGRAAPLLNQLQRVGLT